MIITVNCRCYGNSDCICNYHVVKFCVFADIIINFVLLGERSITTRSEDINRLLGQEGATGKSGGGGERDPAL